MVKAVRAVKIFTGQYMHGLDAKGRAIMPSRFRELLGDSFVITKGYEGCLFAYPNEEWNAFAEKLMNMPEHSPATRRITRIFAAGAINCAPDKQGRVLLPAHLREYAAIEKDIIFVGNFSKVEIWSAARWESYNNDEDALSLEAAAEMLGNLGG